MPKGLEMRPLTHEPSYAESASDSCISKIMIKKWVSVALHRISKSRERTHVEFHSMRAAIRLVMHGQWPPLAYLARARSGIDRMDHKVGDKTRKKRAEQVKKEREENDKNPVRPGKLSFSLMTPSSLKSCSAVSVRVPQCRVRLSLISAAHFDFASHTPHPPPSKGLISFLRTRQLGFSLGRVLLGILFA
jgi:hypothetical protein